MNRIGLGLAAAALLAGCGGDEEAGGLTADERRRLENIAERLDEERSAVRETLEGSGEAVEEEAVEEAAPAPEQENK